MSPGSLDQKTKKRWFKRLKKRTRPRKHVEWAIKIWDCKSGHDQHFPTPSLASSDEDGRNSCVATKETTSVGLLKRESPSHHGCFNYITYLKNRRYSATIFVPHLLCVWFSERRFGKNHIEDTMSK